MRRRRSSKEARTKLEGRSKRDRSGIEAGSKRGRSGRVGTGRWWEMWAAWGRTRWGIAQAQMPAPRRPGLAPFPPPSAPRPHARAHLRPQLLAQARPFRSPWTADLLEPGPRLSRIPRPCDQRRIVVLLAPRLRTPVAQAYRQPRPEPTHRFSASVPHRRRAPAAPAVPARGQRRLTSGYSTGASFEQSSASRSSGSLRRRGRRRFSFSAHAATAATSLVNGAGPSWGIAGPPFV